VKAFRQSLEHGFGTVNRNDDRASKGLAHGVCELSSCLTDSLFFYSLN
jgi:hypothetical protein